MKKIILAAASIAMACGIGFAAVGCGTKGDIVVISRESGSGTRGAFMELIGLEDNELVAGADEVNGTDVVTSSVEDAEKAIGYISLGSLDTSRVKAIKIGGVDATVDNVKNETYKLARPFNVAWDKDGEENALRDDFLKYLASSQAQEIISEDYISNAVSPVEYVSPGNLEGTLTVGGSSSVTPLMQDLAKAYEELNAEVTVTITQTDSGTGMKDAAAGTIDLGMASRELKDSETSDLEYTAIALDGIAVIVNKANPCTDLSVDQLKAIYSGEVENWADVGVTFSEE